MCFYARVKYQMVCPISCPCIRTLRGLSHGGRTAGGRSLGETPGSSLAQQEASLRVGEGIQQHGGQHGAALRRVHAVHALLSGNTHPEVFRFSYITAGCAGPRFVLLFPASSSTRRNIRETQHVRHSVQSATVRKDDSTAGARQYALRYATLR